ncbi:MAG: hypothetical protein K2X87_18900 [Gemmataceae bacterium]|nr:hypothetical protein [Gemmataceae bacterium]
MPRMAFPALLVVAAGAVAAPVPAGTDEPARIRALYGAPDEAAAGCALRLRGTELLVRTPGPPGAYRLSRTLTGDFDLRVKLAFLDAPNRAVRQPHQSLETKAGLVAGGDGHTFAIYRYRAYHLNNGEPQDGLDEAVWVEEMRPDGGEGRRLADGPAGPVYLGLTRKDGVVAVTWGRDGEEWAEPWPAATAKLPDRLTVSLLVSHTTEQACEVRFDRPRLTVPTGR